MESTPGLGPINWNHYTHKAMWQMIVDDADPATMFDEAEKLRKLAQDMGDINTLANAVAQQLLGTWNGDAAQKAAGWITEFLNWADHTANTANSIADLLNQYSRVVNRARLTMPEPIQAGDKMNNHVVTTAQAAASKTEATHVMEHYASQSRDIYAQLHQHQFTAPPSGGPGLPLPPPAPEPPPPAHQPPTPPQTTTDATSPQSTTATTPSAAPQTTTPSDFTGSTSGAMPGVPTGGTAGTVSGLPGGGGLSSGALSTGGAAGAALLGPGAMSGVGAAEEAAGMESVAGAAMEEPGGWNGFAPMPAGGRAPGDQDGKHQNKYGLKHDLVGELPPAFPPVLGL